MLICGILFLGILTSLLLLVPQIIYDIREFLESFPEIFLRVSEKFNEYFNTFGIQIPVDFNELSVWMKEEFLEVFSGQSSILAQVSKFSKNAIFNVVELLLVIFYFFLGPIFFIYIIMGYEQILQNLYFYIPKKFQGLCVKYSLSMDNILSGYIRGQLLVSLILAVSYGGGLFFIGLPFGFIVGLLTGFFSIIPYVGSFLGLTLSILIALTYADIWSLLAVFLLFGVIQFFESFFITPRLVGNKVGLSSLMTILSLIVWGNFFGFFGMLIAIPITAFLQVIFLDVSELYFRSSFYRQGS